MTPWARRSLASCAPAKIGKLRGVERVVRRGKDVCALSGELYQNDELVATATATALIRRM